MNALASTHMGSGTIRETHTSLEVVDAPLASLHPHPRNPRTITPARLAQLCRTIEAERDMLRARPIVALPDGTVIAGNQRLAAALELGWDTIPTVFADLDDERAVRWMLLDNRGFGADDAGMVAELLAEIEGAGSDLLLTGYETGETDRLLRAYRLRDKDPDDAPPLPAGEPRSRRGEVYELGPHRLMCGDATEEVDVAALIGSCRPDAIFTDPPYGVNYQGDEDPESLRRRHRRSDGRATVANDALGDEGTRSLVAAALGAAIPNLTSGASIYVTSPSGPSETAFRLAFLDAGLTLRQVLVWAKDQFAFGRQDYHWRHESILYGWTNGAHRWRGGRSQDTVWEIARPKRSELHPTMKPVALVERALQNSTGYGEAVLDLFAGAGSTMIACEALGRRCLAMEIDPAYCDVIRDRYEAFVA